MHRRNLAQAHRLLVAGAAAALALASVAQATGGESAKLAAALKPAIQNRYKNGDVFSRVTCDLPSATATSATCHAYFTNTGQHEKGVFDIAVKIARSTGNITWHAKSVSCTALKTGQKVDC